MINKKEETFIDILHGELKKRNNPMDLKPAIIGKVVELEPLTVQISNGNVLLVEGEELEIAEWFRFRCNIDATEVLSSTVTSELKSAQEIKETHSYTGTD